MIACMGYIAPEYFRWPGYCSPSTGVLNRGLHARTLSCLTGQSRVSGIAHITDTRSHHPDAFIKSLCHLESKTL